ncbi:MAG: glycosyl transferase family 8 [Deltaproteobacteria bacterium]|jgi:lipopolysaccharide biosynthesis glycosyltransferase|nr:glycosyl transferase family 8 [Deltaproteobacteria bacterium]
MPEDRKSRKACVIVLGVTQNHAFAAGCVLQAIRRHSPKFGADIILCNDGDLLPRDAELLAELGATLATYAPPDIAMRAKAIENFSRLSLARFECLRLLRFYETAIWLDVDIAVQRDISGLASFGPFALSLEDPMLQHPPHPQAKASINTLAPIRDLDGNADNYNSGVLVCRHTLPDPEKLYRLCMQWLEEHAPILNFPDQAVVNMLAQYLTRQDPALVERIPCDVYNAHPKNPAAADAAIVHAFSVFKFWSNGLIGCCFPEWERDYRDWVRKGGSPWRGPVENARCRERGAFSTLHSMLLNEENMRKHLRGRLDAALARSDDAEKRLHDAERARDDAFDEASGLREELALVQAQANSAPRRPNASHASSQSRARRIPPHRAPQSSAVFPHSSSRATVLSDFAFRNGSGTAAAGFAGSARPQ